MESIIVKCFILIILLGVFGLLIPADFRDCFEIELYPWRWKFWRIFRLQHDLEEIRTQLGYQAATGNERWESQLRLFQNHEALRRILGVGYQPQSPWSDEPGTYQLTLPDGTHKTIYCRKHKTESEGYNLTITKPKRGK